MKQSKNKKLKRTHRALDLEGKVKDVGGQTGFGLDTVGEVTASIQSGAATYRSITGLSGSQQCCSSTTSIKKTSDRRQRLPTAAAHVVCAISENLAKETCVASLDACAPLSLQVTKQGNGQTYAETLAYLELLCPDEVLLNEGRRNSQLARKILELYDVRPEMKLPASGTAKDNDVADSSGPAATSIVVKFISRACFDQTKGAELLQRVARDDTYDATVVDEYILLSSAHAVLHYTQQNLGASFSRKSLQLMVNSGGTNKMAIDRSTILQLELLANARSGKTKSSLISTIDHTKTTVGQRLLRTNLMSPPTRVDTITSRLDLVDSFLADEDFFFAVLEHLRNLPCLDKMLTTVGLVPRTRVKKNASNAGAGIEVTKRIARNGISALVGIKTTLSALPAFVRVLEERVLELDALEGNPKLGSTSIGEEASIMQSSILIGLGSGPTSCALCLKSNHLLRAIVLAMKNPMLATVFETVTAAFTSSTTSSQRNSHAMRHEECFALRADEDSMISVVRKAFLSNVDDIYVRADQYAETYGFYVSVRYSASRGYYLAVPEEINNLPSIFIHPSKSGRFIHCSTEEIQSLNIRAQDNYQDLLFMTDAKIQEVLKVARSHYDALASLSDAIAILDMCHGFADCVTLKNSKPWCRPIFRSVEDECSGSNRGMVIRNGRYAIEISNDGHGPSNGLQEFISNDTYTTKATNFTVITGINGSGKSTYLKQIAIMVVLAHCGSYVPAEYALIPILHRLCTRIGNTDDQENNISTFMLEMKETAFICRNATSQSLILIDELGRATSNEDGVAIAWAVSEWLLQSNALTFFVTHYPQITMLGNMYPSVQNQHMEASVESSEGGEILYTHKVAIGPCSVSTSYGVDLASACGWENDVLLEASRIESRLKDLTEEAQLFPARLPVKPEPTLASSLSSAMRMLAKLYSLSKTCEEEKHYPYAAVREKLQQMRESFVNSVYPLCKDNLWEKSSPAPTKRPARPAPAKKGVKSYLRANSTESNGKRHSAAPAATESETGEKSCIGNGNYSEVLNGTMRDDTLSASESDPLSDSESSDDSGSREDSDSGSSSSSSDSSSDTSGSSASLPSYENTHKRTC